MLESAAATLRNFGRAQPFAGAVSLVNDLWTYRGLVGNLAQRELKSRYKRSVLGWLWSLLNPAATLATYAVVFGVLFNAKVTTVKGEFNNFTMYLFAGLVIWNFFSAVVNGSMTSLIAAGPLLKKVCFPPECAPAANMIVAMSQALIESMILILVMAILGNLGWAMLLLPILLALVAIFAFGIGLALSVANVYLRDIAYLVAVLMNLMFYATPIVYPESVIAHHPAIKQLVNLNPMHQFVKATRDAVYWLRMPSAFSMGVLVLISFASLTLGWIIFRRFGDDVSEVL